jgi:hypothetical protein
MTSEDECLIQLTLNWPYGNYSGPGMFHASICKLSKARKLKTFLSTHADETFNFFSETDYTVKYSEIKLKIIKDEEKINAFKLLSDSKFSSIDLLEIIRENRSGDI